MPLHELGYVGLLNVTGATTSQTSTDQPNSNHRGIKVVLDVTDVSASPSVTVTIKGKDRLSGKTWTLLAGAAVTTAVTNVYTVFPGATASTNVAANDQLPDTWQVTVTANNANACTYTVAAHLLP